MFRQEQQVGSRKKMYMQLRSIGTILYKSSKVPF